MDHTHKVEGSTVVVLMFKHGFILRVVRHSSSVILWWCITVAVSVHSGVRLCVWRVCVCWECVCVGSVCEGVEVKVCRVQSFSRVILANRPGFSETVLETDLNCVLLSWKH